MFLDTMIHKILGIEVNGQKIRKAQAKRKLIEIRQIIKNNNQHKDQRQADNEHANAATHVWQLIRDKEFMDMYHNGDSKALSDNGKVNWMLLQNLKEYMERVRGHTYPPTPEDSIEIKTETYSNYDEQDQDGNVSIINSDSSIDNEIKAILAHKYRWASLKIKVMWEGYEDTGPIWENSENILTHEHEIAIRKYINKLRKEKPRSLKTLIQRYPIITDILN